MDRRMAMKWREWKVEAGEGGEKCMHDSWREMTIEGTSECDAFFKNNSKCL